MSGIRKLKRDKSLHKEQKTSTKLSLGGIVLVVGIATLLFGSFYAIYNHIVYTSGRSEHTLETKGGPILLPEEARVIRVVEKVPLWAGKSQELVYY